MKFLCNSVQSDFEKIKRQPILLMHILYPILTIILFNAYYLCTHWQVTSKAKGFLVVNAMVFPVLIASISSMAVEQEGYAGNFQNMLTSSKRITTFLSKIITFLFMGAISILILTCGFSVAFTYILHQNPFTFSYYLYSAFILFLSSIFIYILHFIISFIFGGNISITLGVFETLLSALFFTNLGDGKWIFAPCTWSMRFIMNFYNFVTRSPQFNSSISELYTGIIVCILGTIVITILTCFWASKWEGRRSL
ncbi:lantibiotic immunity ABC transporter MutG family permease subunit [Clostridium felsineum]|uniref:lantibiotic immunity ABC transporter MutG family permease subunit n=1 Tax=Clostridium felsineum TaxID=36839 RepID=UPI00214D5ADB|nr:lantibiotic immunity ABC transporter MutG family permease subunit [Clostridium felsineum]MCR3758627.1 lantibiotic immunity ABC transporter MutG family permease subunit [Clostridium felsineum]